MRFVFWQNCISPLQMPYISELRLLSGIEKVTVIVEKDIDRTRADLGWEISKSSNNTNVIVSPGDNEIETIIKENTEDSWHFFSGIRGFKMVFNAFQISLKYNVRRCLITEGPFTYAFGVNWGKPLWLHWLRYKIQDRRYLHYIDIVFAIGEKAELFFKSINPAWKVVPFTYCTKQQSFIDCTPSGELKICFVGALSERKSVITLLKSICRIEKDKISASICGVGPEFENLDCFARKHRMSNIEFMGAVKNNILPSILAKHDILVLPSIHDGWGAVVNEALQQGLYVICSDACGAKELLRDKRRGLVFKSGSVNELRSHLTYCIENLENIRNTRKYRYEWAAKHISGETISRYMFDVLNGEDVIVPWLQDDENTL